MPRAIALAMLIAPPALALLGGGFFVILAMRFRRSFGAMSDLPAGGKAMVAGLLLLHVGYLAAPFLHVASRRGLALWLTTPMAVVGTIALVVTAAVAARTEVPWPVLIALASIVLYWTPIAALVWGR